MANVYAYMRISTKEDKEKQRFSRAGEENIVTENEGRNSLLVLIRQEESQGNLTR